VPIDPDRHAGGQGVDPAARLQRVRREAQIRVHLARDAHGRIVGLHHAQHAIGDPPCLFCREQHKN
jgi:hypothetical protein